MGDIYLISGGARSGKSKWGEHLACRLSPHPTYLASAQAFDEEMQERIQAHQDQRGDRFITVEAPLQVAAALVKTPAEGTVLWDCLTLWLSNMILAGADDASIAADLQRILAVAAERLESLVVVTNEVGLGIVPESKLGRRFRDLAGRVHQDLSLQAKEVYLTVMGLPLRIKPGPVEVMAWT